VTTTMWSPFSMVMLLWKSDGNKLSLPSFFFLFLLLWSFWSSSLKLTMKWMKWWFFLMLKVVMAKGRKLKKGGDLEVQKQNVTSLE
jgi:hypothetical protein